MFGTLIIGLPSAHTGGELSLRFDGTEKSVNFHDHPTYEMPFVSFYGDCEHEISPVTSGYRVCLAYNLVSNKKKTITQPKAAKHYVKKLSTILAHTMSKEENLSAPQLLLLDHQYTPTNFSLNELKGNDRLRAVSLLEAAEGSPYHAKLCLLTHYQMGELEGGYDFDRYRNYGNSNEKGEMGEIYEEYSQVKHWGEDKLPSMGELDVSNSNFINKLQINGNPIEEYEEGYTGNAGMSMEYWYHYGAIMLWSKTHHFDLLSSQTLDIKLSWLSYYLEQKDDETVGKMLTSLKDHHSEVSYYYNFPNCDVIAKGLIYLNNCLMLDACEVLLSACFLHISIEDWLRLAEQFEEINIHGIIQKVLKEANLSTFLHFVALLEKGKRIAPLKAETQHIPNYLALFFKNGNPKNNTQKSDAELISEITKHILLLSEEQDKDWKDRIFTFYSEKPSRTLVHNVLAPVFDECSLMEYELTKKLLMFYISYLADISKEKPQPPKDWTRSYPRSKHWVWDILSDFLESATEERFEYKKNKNYRMTMMDTVRNAGIDVNMETLTKSSPHTLVLTKNQKNYKRKLQQWNKDLALLRVLEKKVS